MNELTCPNCSAPIRVGIESIVPDWQRFTIQLTNATDYFGARVIGETICNMEKLLVAVAAESGAKVNVHVQEIELKPCLVTITFIICRNNTKPDEVQS